MRYLKQLFRSTKNHTKYWKERQIDWKADYLENSWEHPHRDLIMAVLSRIYWNSLLEIGVGAGANLKKILHHFRGKQLGGIDVSEKAIAVCQENFNGGFFKVGSAEDIMMSDKSTDVVLTDMTLIYIDPSKINKVIKEIKRVARHYVVFCELHSKSIFDIIRLKLASGYNMYDYERLLERHGFHDISLIKIPKEMWDGKPQIPYGYILVARVPKEYD